MSSITTGAPQTSNAWFVTTHWSVVLSAREKDSPQCGPALETLCQTYWYPLYAYVRRQGRSPHDAQDLTQAFFERLLKKDYLRLVAPEKGKFRTFLLVAMKRFLVNERARGRTQRRGGNYAHVPLEVNTAETRYLTEPAAQLTAEKLYERRWALTLLDKVLERLRQEFTVAGRTEHFEQLKGYLMAEKGGIPYAEAASSLGTSEGAVKVAVHRLRRRFRELFREEVAHTVTCRDEVEEEIRHLLQAFNP